MKEKERGELVDIDRRQRQNEERERGRKERTMKFVKWDQANDLQCKYDNGSTGVLIVNFFLL